MRQRLGRRHLAGRERAGHPGLHGPRAGRGEIDHLDERADVFGLGAILCEILTGQPPYVFSDAGELKGRAARAELDDALDPPEHLVVPTPS